MSTPYYTSGVVTYTRRWRDLFRKKYWVQCWFCDYCAGPFKTDEEIKAALIHDCQPGLDWGPDYKEPGDEGYVEPEPWPDEEDDPVLYLDAETPEQGGKGAKCHGGVKVYTRRWRDLFRKRYWVGCCDCGYRAGPFRTEEEQIPYLRHDCVFYLNAEWVTRDELLERGYTAEESKVDRYEVTGIGSAGCERHSFSDLQEAQTCYDSMVESGEWEDVQLADLQEHSTLRSSS